ncbi:HAD hydrolase family protein [Coraliomargarita sp. SDUM461004]|uniref:HAD hydrolase family protein n=1 Tax=Thalassobacterium sedimentorum TaxID=3041258 RepID=A0ABU1AKK4_9BACT|nr:HAD hydrolase family protein [Coraliomargarita sp. SDUM461004]MDQ8195345.1 HAD hydrolase family protein [Coraliomargarita sp. SDUM461004]
MNQIRMLRSIDDAVEASTLDFFVMNTGRPWSLVRNIVQHFKSSKLRYCLLEHACVLYDRETDRTIDCAALAKRYGFVALADRYENIRIIEKLIAWYRARGQAQLEAHYGVDLSPIEKFGNLSFVIPVEADGGEVLQRIESLARADLDPLQIDQLDFVRSDRYIDVLPGIHKLDGIHLLTKHLGVALNEAMAVGDYLNDLTVFECFDQVMCPANAHPDIQALARSKGSGGFVSRLSYGAALLQLLSD